MSLREPILSLVNSLIDPCRRQEAAGKLASLLGVETLIIFLPDSETGTLLSAKGFPQTFPDGIRWRNFLNQCTSEKPTESAMPWGSKDNLVKTTAVASHDGAVIAFIGGSDPKPKVMDELLLVLPLLTAALKGEAIANRQVAEAKFAAETAKESGALARRLDDARRALQKELEARHATEKLLRARELDLEKTVDALQQAREALQQHATELESRVADRTVQLHETIEELERFSYSIVHDMRAPLRAMQSFSQLLEKDCAGEISDAGKDYLRRIIGSASRMDSLIRDVLTYSRVTRSEMPIANVNLTSLVQGVLESYPQLQPPHVELDVQKPLPTVRGNEAALTQCFSNLLGNAVKFVKPGGTPKIKIYAESRDSWSRIWIEDKGIGIPNDQHGRIFEIFQRLNQDYEGTGIGLAIVKKAVERMGGEIGLASVVGQGSSFWFELPDATKHEVNQFEMQDSVKS